MSALQKILPDDLGIPYPPEDSYLKMKPKDRVISWYPYMKTTGIAEYFLVARKPGQIREFIAKGGDPASVIVHHMSYDEGVIDPLWGTNYFLKWIETLKEMGVTKILAPDFSTWADMPVVLQLHNHYRSAVVTHDYAKAGFKIVPNAIWSHPNLHPFIMAKFPGKIPTITVQATHVYTDQTSQKYFWRGLDRFLSTVQFDRVLVYANTPRLIKDWESRYGKGPWQWVGSYTHARSQMCNVQRKLKEKTPVK